MLQLTPKPSLRKLMAISDPRARRAAVGKALIVYLLSGSIGVAIVAFVIFKVAGC